MTLAALSLPLVAIALALTVGWLSSGALAWVWLRLVRRRADLDHTALAVFALPWMLALAALLAALLPGDPHTGEVLVCHCLDSMPGWFHLCPVHPERAWPLVLPALVALMVLLPARIRGLVHLARLPVGRGGDWPEVVPLAEPVAILHGWWKPGLVVDASLWSALDASDKRAVLAHEQAHLDRRDPLLVVVLQALMVLGPPTLAVRVVRRWLAGAERRADAAAAHAVGDPTLVATALVRCARLGSTSVSLAPGWTAGSVEDRVHHLLDLPDTGRPARADLRASQLLALGVGLSLCLAGVPWLHHQLEHLLNLFL